MLARDKFVKKLKAASDYLKYGYPMHIEHEDDCAHNSCATIVGYPTVRRQPIDVCSITETVVGSKWSKKCRDCLKSFQFIEDTRGSSIRTRMV